MNPTPEAGDILILGAGAIGGLIGARLALAGDRVTLVGRPAWRDAVVRDGLRLRVGDAPPLRAGTVRAFGSLADANDGRRYDWLLLTTRAHSVLPALTEAAETLATVPPVVCFQNGLGAEQRAASVVGPHGVVAATITTPVELEGPATLGTVHKGGIGLARWADGPDPAPLAARLRAAGFRVRAYRDANAMLWSKLLLNIIGNATSALLGWPPEQIMADGALYELELAALREALTVMRAMGIPTVNLPGYPVTLQMALLMRLPMALTQPAMRRLVAGGRGGKLPSLALALASGSRTTEVDVLNGAIAEAGTALGIPVSVNRALAQLVTQVAAGEIGRERFLNQPDRLLAALAASAA